MTGIAERFRESGIGERSTAAPSIIVFSGNRKGMSDEEGLENCADRSEESHLDGRRQELACLHGAAEQQGESPRLHVRPHEMGRRVGASE